MADFEFSGINHLALVCADMDVTVDFYTNVLGMPLTKTLDLPNGRGKHFFFDIGNGDSLAFFWFSNGPKKVSNDRLRQIAATPGTMNHVAFNVAPDNIQAYRDRLVAKGIEATEVVNHADVPSGVSVSNDETVFVRSIYFFDPDGIQLEFAAWTRELNERDVSYSPAS